MRRPQVGVKAQVKTGAVVPPQVHGQMQERRIMALTLYRAETACLWEVSRRSFVYGAPLVERAAVELAACAGVQKRHERIMAAAVQTFDLMTWGRETGLQAI